MAASDLTVAQYIGATNCHCDVRNDNRERNDFNIPIC